MPRPILKMVFQVVQVQVVQLTEHQLVQVARVLPIKGMQVETLLELAHQTPKVAAVVAQVVQVAVQCKRPFLGLLP